MYRATLVGLPLFLTQVYQSACCSCTGALYDFPRTLPDSLFLNAPSALPPPAAPAAAPARTIRMVRMDPTDEPCPCMTTPAPGSVTDAPGSPEEAKKEVRSTVDDAGADVLKDVNEDIREISEDEIAQLKAAERKAKAAAKDEIGSVQDKELDAVAGGIADDRQAQHGTLRDMRAHAKQTAEGESSEIVAGAAAAGGIKAHAVVGSLEAGAQEEVFKSEARITALREQVEELVRTGHVGAERVENAAKEAELIASKDPIKRSREAIKLATEAEEQTMSVEETAVHAQRMAEMAARVAVDAQNMAKKAITTAQGAERSADNALAGANYNKALIVKLRARAALAVRNVKEAFSEAANAERNAHIAKNDAETYMNR